jgi:hypothetical protein
METKSTRTALPVCILATAGEEKPEIVCLRVRVPGQIASVFTIEQGTATAFCRRGDRVEPMAASPVDARTVDETIGEAIDGALLVAWDLDAVAEALRAYHPAPEQILARGVVELDLRAAALLAGVGLDTLDPTIEGLAQLLSLLPPGDGAKEQAWFVARAVRRLASSATWLGRVLALGFDERSIVGTCVERLGAGTKAYGPWDLDDGRDYAREAYEEVIDGLHYAAAGLLKLQDRARDTEVA